MRLFLSPLIRLADSLNKVIVCVLDISLFIGFINDSIMGCVVRSIDNVVVCHVWKRPVSFFRLLHAELCVIFYRRLLEQLVFFLALRCSLFESRFSLVD